MRWAAAALALASLLAGCAGGRFRIVAPNVSQPVSASAVLFDANLKPLHVPDDLEVVDHFRHTERHWSILWTAVPLQAVEHDLSELFAEKIRAADGDAITSVQGTCEWNMLLEILGWVPLVPTVATARIEGDVVRRRPQPAAP